jgi:O-antigen/teichoic acid export membrane protein
MRNAVCSGRSVPCFVLFEVNQMFARVNELVARFLDLAISRGAPNDERHRRSRSVVRGTITAIAARAFGTVTGLIMVPLTLRYLGATRYGAWMTISSFLLFLNFTDFGLTSSLTNALGKAFGENKPEEARSYITTTLLTLTGVGAVLMVVGILVAEPVAKVLFPQLEPPLLRGEIIPALILSIAVFAISFPLMVTNRVLAAYQENTKANVWVAISSGAGLIGAFAAICYRANLPVLVVATSGSGLLVTLASTVWLFGWHKQWLRPKLLAVDATFLRELFSSGWKFFIMNVGWMINSQTDNMIISHYLGAAAVTPYAVTFRLFAYATLLQTLIFPSLWPAITEAAARKDYDWIQGVYRKTVRISLAIAIGLLAVLTLFGREIIRLWAGPPAVPTIPLIALMAICNLLLAYLYVPGCFFQAMNHLNWVTLNGVTTALLNLVLSIVFVRRFGVIGVMAGTVLSYTVASYIPVLFQSRRLWESFDSPHSQFSAYSIPSSKS